MRKRRRWVLLCALLLIYISSYYILSRRGFALADEYGLKGSHFFPTPSSTWRCANWACVGLYYPLIKIDQVVVQGIQQLSDGATVRLLDAPVADAGAGGGQRQGGQRPGGQGAGTTPQSQL